MVNNTMYVTRCFWKFFFNGHLLYMCYMSQRNAACILQGYLIKQNYNQPYTQSKLYVNPKISVQLQLVIKQNQTSTFAIP